MNEDPSQASDPEAEPSVFGNLPRTRPGSRSPRRDAAKETAARGGRSAAATSRRSAPRAASTRTKDESVPSARRTTPRRNAPSDPETETDEGGGLEELAWAGVAAAAEAATLGVRLANRALESLRGGSERS
jgi:hypothetical protein